MELYHYVLATGQLTTSTSTGDRLVKDFHAAYGGVLGLSDLAWNEAEKQRFCEFIRQEWEINAPNEVIIHALKEAVVR